MLNGHRYRSGSSVNKEEFIDVKITEQPLVVSNGSTKVRKWLKKIAVALEVGGVSGATGAGVHKIIDKYKEQKHDLDPTVKMVVMDGFI